MEMTTFRNSAQQEADAADSFNRKLIAPMVLGSILNPINSSILSIALIPIGSAFQAPPSQTAWLVSALYLATAIGQPVAGRLIDLYGARRLFLIAVSLVGAAGLLAILAPNLWWLVGARVLLGFGTCAGYPASMALLRREADRTGQESPAGVLTVLAVANQTVAVIGPTLGGWLLEWGGWQSAFLVNVPLSVACLVLGYLRFPKHSPKERGDRSSAVDIPGMGLFAATLLLALLFLMRPSLHSLYFLGFAAVLGVCFGWRELHTQRPFIDLRLLRGNVPLLKTYARNLLAAVVSYSFIYGFTQWLEEGRGLSPSVTGLLMLPMFITALIVSGLAGKRMSVRTKLTVGALTLAVAAALLLTTRDGSALYWLAAITLLAGVPQGLLNLANQHAVFRQAAPEHMGASSGLLRTSAYIGAMLASAASGLFYQTGATTTGIHQLAWFCTAIAALLVGLTLFDRSVTTFSKTEAETVKN